MDKEKRLNNLMVLWAIQEEINRKAIRNIETWRKNVDRRFSQTNRRQSERFGHGN